MPHKTLTLRISCMKGDTMVLLHGSMGEFCRCRTFYRWGNFYLYKGEKTWKHG